MRHTIMTSIRQSLFLALLQSSFAFAAEPASPPLFPFVLPWDDATPAITDLSGWLPKPAGKAGHVRVGADGHFYAGNDRIRFLGVNMAFGANVPTKPDAERIAGRLAKFGINVVRFHHGDTGHYPDGLRDRSAQGTGQVHPEALDRLHYFIAQLREHGIYANINLLVGRPFNAADGLPAEIEQLGWKERHIVGFFSAKQLELQEEYARRLLTPKNPYTGLSPTEDPAVAFMEINNENGLVHGWLGQDVDSMPAVFLRDLQQQWNAWLAKKHGTTAKLRQAWSEGAQPLGVELLRNADFAQQLQGWTLEKHSGAEAGAAVVNELPSGAKGKAVRVSVTKPGAEAWHVQFNQAGLKFEQGKSYTLRFWAKADAGRTLSAVASQAHEPWGNLGLSANPRVTNQWREFRFVFTASQRDDQCRITFGSFGPAGSTVTLAGLSLRPGGLDGLKESESLEAQSVARFEKGTFGERTPEAQRDWMRFLMDTEDRYWQAMLRFLKDDLKVKALVTGTIGGCAPLNSMAKMDWVDTHAYWQHPRFPRRPWDSEDWIVDNKPMVNEAGGTLPRLASYRVAGKPHACTEYNHPAPNTYNNEGHLLLAAYAALQDWDALYAYCYAHSRSAGWDSKKINGFFDIDQHPTKMATLLPAAAMFLRGDVKPARRQVTAPLSWEREADLLRTASSWSLVNAGHLGIAKEAALEHRVALIPQGGSTPPAAMSPDQSKPSGPRFTSDTGEFDWDLGDKGRGVVTINTAHSKAVIGFGGGKRFDLGGTVVEPGASMQNGWAAISLTAIDADAATPSRWLITATGQAENTGQKWKSPEKNSVGRNWGSAPSVVEGVPARITFPQEANTVEVWSLDERGQRKEKLPVETGVGGKAVINLGPRWQTLWYEVNAK